MNKSKRILAAVAVVAFVSSVGTGYALAAGRSDTAADTQKFDRTADGRTIGTLPATGDSFDPADMPNLVEVVADNGREGFVDSTLLGGPGADAVSSPEEAIKWQESAPKNWEIPVYAKDGVTVVGTFTVLGPDLNPISELPK